MVSKKTLGRLSLYRRLLMKDSRERVSSGALARLAGATASQVRRDLMMLQVSGGPRGYSRVELCEAISSFLDGDAPQKFALIGVGNLGRALISYFNSRRPMLELVAAFDSDPHKIGRVIHGCRCHDVKEITEKIQKEDIRLAVLTVPASVAQELATELVDAGVRAILNFAPLHLKAPSHVSIEDIDITMALEKLAFLAQKDDVDPT